MAKTDRKRAIDLIDTVETLVAMPAIVDLSEFSDRIDLDQMNLINESIRDALERLSLTIWEHQTGSVSDRPVFTGAQEERIRGIVAEQLASQPATTVKAIPAQRAASKKPPTEMPSDDGMLGESNVDNSEPPPEEPASAHQFNESPYRGRVSKPKPLKIIDVLNGNIDRDSILALERQQKQGVIR